MKIVKLGSLIKEYSIKYKNTADDIPVYSVTNSSGFKKSTDYFNKEVFSADLSSYKLVYKNSFAYNPSRINVGSISYQGIEDVVLVSPLYNVFSINEKITPRYLNYFFKSNYSKNYIKNHTSGSVRSNFRIKDMSDMDIILPSLEEQERFVDELNDIEYNIALLTKQVNNYDEIVKSQFIGMFGDVIKNDKGFDSCAFGDYVNQMNIGPFGSDLKNDCFVSIGNGYCMVYEQKHAIDKDMMVEARYVSKEKYEKLKKFDIGPGDIIVSCRGTIGQCFILPDNAPHGIIHPSLMMIKPKNDVNHKFLLFLLEHIMEEQQEQGSGVKMAIKATELAKIETIKPSRILQDRFIDFIEQIDKSKYFGGVNYGIC